MENSLVSTMFLIFTGAAIFATLALYARQMMIVAYIVLGILLGPTGVDWVPDTIELNQISSIGITFLLFLLGLDMSPIKLIKLFRSTSFIAGTSSIIFAAVGFGFGQLWGFDVTNSLILGITMMFSSTIIGLKLLPTTVLHHKPTGEIIISILLIQDLFAIIALFLLKNIQDLSIIQYGYMLLIQVLSLPLLIFGAWALQKFIITKLLIKFDTIREYIFLLAIGWCLGIAQLAYYIGLSHEAGAFIAGITLATNPIALHIADSLKPIRDFFLIIFFFTLGALVEWDMTRQILLPALILAGLMLVIKPLVLRIMMQFSGQGKAQATEIGFRLGQCSEFSLLIGALALESGMLMLEVSYLIQITTLLTFFVSPYFIVLRYPTPIAISKALRRD